MTNLLKYILKNIRFTKLVYGRINKKLNLALSNNEIEKLVNKILKKINNKCIEIHGKNIYAANYKYNIVITINKNTCRVITINKFN